MVAFHFYLGFFSEAAYFFVLAVLFLFVHGVAGPLHFVVRELEHPFGDFRPLLYFRLAFAFILDAAPFRL